MYAIDYRMNYKSIILSLLVFFFSSRRRHTRWPRDWSSDVCSSDLPFSVYIDAEPAQDNKVLLEKEQLAYGEHGQTVRVLQKKLAALSYYQDDIDGQYGVYTKQVIIK